MHIERDDNIMTCMWKDRNNNIQREERERYVDNKACRHRQTDTKTEQRERERERERKKDRQTQRQTKNNTTLRQRVNSIHTIREKNKK